MEQSMPDVFSREWAIANFLRELAQRGRIGLRSLSELPYECGCITGEHYEPLQFVAEQRGVLRQGEIWDGDAVWQFYLDLELSAQERSAPLWLEADLQGEGTVYVGEQAVGSLDTAHDAALIYRPGEPLSDSGRLAVRIMQTKHVHNQVRVPRLFGKPNVELVFRSLSLMHYSQSISRFLYLGKALLQIIQSESDSALADPLFNLLKDAILELDLDESRELLEQQCEAVRQQLLSQVQALELGTHHGRYLFNGHSHLDIAFKWRIKDTIRKIERTNANTLRLLPLYPEAKFTQSQAWILEQTEARYHQQFAQLQALREQGQVSFLGGMYVEPDTNLPCGEFLARQLIVGQQYQQAKTGAVTDTCYLPDTFGYAGCLPQLLVQAGFRYFVTTKLAWNDTNEFPHHLFNWQGLDGSAVTAYLLPVAYGGPIEYQRVKDIADSGRNTPLTVVQYGEGDGGGGISREMLETLTAFKQLDLLAEFSDSNLPQAMATISELGTAAGCTLPVVQGELYFEKHRGVYTSQAAIKDYNRKLEQAYLNAELLASLSQLHSKQAYPGSALERALKSLLVNQFHDIISGSLVKAAVDDAVADYQRVEQQLADLQQQSISGLFAPGSEHDYVVLNLLSFARSDVISVELPADHALYQGEQRLIQWRLPAEPGVVHARVDLVPAMGYCSLQARPDDWSLLPEAAVLPGWSEQPLVLENTRYKLIVMPNGELSQLYDKQQRRELLRGAGNTLEVFKEYSGYFDSWDVFSDFERKQVPVEQCRIRRLLHTDSVQQVQIERRLRHSVVNQTITLQAHSELIDIDVQMDVQDRNLLFKLGFDTVLRAELASFDASFGLVERATGNATPQQQAQFEVPMHKWCDLSDTQGGLSLINENKYGCDIKGGKLRLTLLKTGVFPDPAQDLGQHHFRFALYPHQGELRDPRCQAVALAKAYNNPLQVLTKQHAPDAAAETHSFISLDSRSSYIEAVKLAEDGAGYIVRLAEQLGQADVVNLKLALPSGDSGDWQWCETDLLERALTPLRSDPVGLALRPFEVKTLYLCSL